jgi:hypothetical protein
MQRRKEEEIVRAKIVSRVFVQSLHTFRTRTLTSHIPAEQKTAHYDFPHCSLLPLRPSRPPWFASLKTIESNPANKWLVVAPQTAFVFIRVSSVAKIFFSGQKPQIPDGPYFRVSGV